MRAGHDRERVADGLHLAAKGIKSPEVASADTKAYSESRPQQGESW